VAARTFLYTPKVHNSPGVIDRDLRFWHERLSWTVEAATHPDRQPIEFDHDRYRFAELVIIDEADRLQTKSLEQVRDHHDRTGIGILLIGMPGIERRLARFPQLYSRIGFAHEYRPLSADELHFVLGHHWNTLGLTLTAEDFADAEATAAVARITQGNFRLVQRLFDQIQRVLDINGFRTITQEVVEAARESLVIGVI